MNTETIKARLGLPSIRSTGGRLESALLTVGLLLVLVLTALLTARSLATASARQAAEKRLYAEAIRGLRPWFSLGLLGADDTRLLVEALTISEEDPALALEATERCMRLTRDPMCALSAGIAYERLGKSDKARSTFLSILANMPSFGAAHLELGKLAQASGQTELAIAEYQAATEYLGEKEKRLAFHALVSLLLSSGHAGQATRPLAQFAPLAQAGESLDDMYLVASAYLQLHDRAQFLATMNAAEPLRKKTKLATYYVLTNGELFRRFDEASGNRMQTSR